MLQIAAAKFTTEQGLCNALEKGEFELVFQPELCLNGLHTTLVEALIRWRLPDGRLATPDEFLPVAEESGLIVSISDWVLASAIEAAAAWHHGAWPEARVAINLSPRQMLDQRFSDTLVTLLNKHSLSAECIEIELTETILQTGPATIETLKRLRRLGTAVALDDFGTGYSSIASLDQLPITRVKLDRSLIAGVDTNARSAVIARAVIAMCYGLGLEVTAEGVERREQFEFLLGYDSTYVQGFLLSRPVSREEVLSALPKIAALAEQLLLQSRRDKGGLAHAVSRKGQIRRKSVLGSVR